MEHQIFYMVSHILQFLLHYKSDNEIVSGIILDPIKNEMFYAEKNNGSYLNNKRIRVSKKKT